MEHMESMMNSRLEGSMLEYEQMSEQIAQLEKELSEAKKDQARYKFVRGMEPEDFENLPTYCNDFDCQVDDLMKRCQK